MKFPCENVASIIVPAIRAEVAIRLSQNHGLRQIEISRMLGITQGAVSHYLTSFRGKQREIIITNPEIESKIEELTFKMVNGEFDNTIFCSVCKKIQSLSAAEL